MQIPLLPLTLPTTTEEIAQSPLLGDREQACRRAEEDSKPAVRKNYHTKSNSRMIGLSVIPEDGGVQGGGR